MIDFRVCVQYCAPIGTRSIFSRKESFFQKIRLHFFFLSLEMDKMDTQMDTDLGEEKGEEGEQEREIEPSKTLISNVSLIKKSVESKGEPRFIASVFRQVCLIYVFNKNSLLVVSFARDLTFIVVVQNNDLSPSSSFFLSIHIYSSSSSSSFLPYITADAHGENEIDRRRYLRVYRGRLTQRFGIRDDVETVFESKENRDEESKRGGRRLWRKLKSELPETEIYCYVLALMHMIDAKDANAIQLSEICLQRLSSFNRRTLDAFAA